MPRCTFKVFSFLGASSFALASLIYWVMQGNGSGGNVFGALPRMFCYHYDHPCQYIAVVCFTYATIGTWGAVRWPHVAGWRRGVLITGILIFTILVASIPGGVLWKIHDMEAGFFTRGVQFWNDLFWGAATGLETGWFLTLLSFPYNMICLVMGYRLTSQGFRISAATADAKPASNHFPPN